jgi:phosphatidylinositol alpha-1,6-mannosyltransferase
LPENRKILIVTTEFPPGPGGIGNHAYSLVKALSAKGFNVYVVTNADYATEEEVETFDASLNDTIQVKRVYRTNRFIYLKRLWHIAGILKKEGVKAVILSGKFSLWAGAILKLMGYRFRSIAVLHGYEVQLANKFYKRFTDFCISKADFLVPVSGFTYGLLTGQLQRKRYKIIENGIDLDEMYALKGDQDKNFSLKGAPALLTVGNVTPRKGQQRVIKALPEIIKHFPGVHYHIVGLPTYKDEFNALAIKLGVEKYVTFHGRLPQRSDLALFYQKAGCFMLLSENQPSGDVEGFGIVILEANVFGLPAVGAKGCGIEDAIKDDFNGYLVDGDNAIDITEKLKKVLENRDRLSVTSVEWAKQHSWNSIVEKYIEIVDSFFGR